jgi:holo-[acyl-carrier protein] synthase
MPEPREDARLILGIGTDLIDIRRVERTLERFGARFRERVFTEVEQARAERHVNPAAAYAKRYAAKEACAKALGTGFRQGVYWRDIGVVNRSSGMPILELRHGAAARLAALTPRGMVARIDLSLTDEPPYAHGMVVISAAPPSESPPARDWSQGRSQARLREQSV